MSNCSRLPTRSAVRVAMPVTFPPGLAKLVINPDSTGEGTEAITIGMVVVTLRTARAALLVPATIS